MPVAELLVKRRQLIKRMQELEQVGGSWVALKHDERNRSS